jgi:hypothetical protein
MAHYYLENWSDSINALTQALDLNPTWEDSIAPFLEKAAEKEEARPKAMIQIKRHNKAMDGTAE